MTESTTLQKLDSKIDAILQQHREAKAELETLRQEIETLKVENEMQLKEIDRLEEINVAKDAEIEAIVTKIENMLS